MTERQPSFVRRHLATNSDIPDVLVGLACDESMWVRREAARNPATPEWVLDLLVRAGADRQLRGRGDPDPDMPPADLRRLVECGPWAQQLVADHPNTTGEVLAVLADQPGERLRLAVASHPNTNPDTLARLCADGDEVTRHRVGARPDAPVAVLTIMRRAGAAPDLAGVTGRCADDDLSPDELTSLAAFGPWGRFLAGRLGSCPPVLLREIAADPDWRIRSAILDNPKAPAVLLAAVAGLDTTDHVETLRVLAAESPPLSRLRSLATHPQPEVRLAVARHPAADGDTIGVLSVDRVSEIRRTASRHERMDRAALAVLVRAGSTPDLAQLAPPDPSVTAAELDELAQGGYWARQLAVRHPDTPPATLAHLLCDGDPKLREWAAAHPAAPGDIVALLLRAGAATDFQGIAPTEDPDMSPEDLARVAALGPYGELIVEWHPNGPS